MIRSSQWWSTCTLLWCGWNQDLWSTKLLWNGMRTELDQKMWEFSCNNNIKIICDRRWMSLQKHSSISGIQSWKYMVSRHLVGRECWRRCQESGWARIRQSTMSLGERCLTEKNIWHKIISVFVLRYPVGWCLMIILLMTTLVSSKLEAVSKE